MTGVIRRGEVGADANFPSHCSLMPGSGPANAIRRAGETPEQHGNTSVMTPDGTAVLQVIPAGHRGARPINPETIYDNIGLYLEGEPGRPFSRFARSLAYAAGFINGKSYHKRSALSSELDGKSLEWPDQFAMLKAADIDPVQALTDEKYLQQKRFEPALTILKINTSIAHGGLISDVEEKKARDFSPSKSLSNVQKEIEIKTDTSPPKPDLANSANNPVATHQSGTKRAVPSFKLG